MKYKKYIAVGRGFSYWAIEFHITRRLPEKTYKEMDELKEKYSSVLFSLNYNSEFTERPLFPEEFHPSEDMDGYLRFRFMDEADEAEFILREINE